MRQLINCLYTGEQSRKRGEKILEGRCLKDRQMAAGA